jgi:hypothetical protein
MAKMMIKQFSGGEVSSEGCSKQKRAFAEKSGHVSRVARSFGAIYSNGEKFTILPQNNPTAIKYTKCPQNIFIFFFKAL